jgi:lysyl-tRNA synthetase class II
MDLLLRIAPELYLSVWWSGFERVFEINRNFRMKESPSSTIPNSP